MADKRKLRSSFFHLQSCRPFSVTLLVIIVLVFTSLNALRTITAIRLGAFLTGLPLDVPVFYLIITGLFWALAGLPLAVALFFGRRWSWYLVRWAVILYSFYYWLDRLFVAEQNAIAARWPFAAGLTVVLIIFTFWVLTRSKTKVFFKISGSSRNAAEEL